MISKELKDVRWRFVIGALLLAWFVTDTVFVYDDWSEDLAADSVQPGTGEELPVPDPPGPQEFLFVSYTSMELPVTLLAAVFGAGLISGENGRRTIFLLLSKPIARSRILLVKYAVGTLALLLAVSLGSAALVLAAGLSGYPVASLDTAGVVMSTVLMWLGSLFVFGLALFVSVFSRDSFVSIPVALLAGLATFRLPVGWGDDGLNPLPQILVLPNFWRSSDLLFGNGLAATNFLVCLVSAATPLLVALWAFGRRAY